jgi:predicted  nucleic acid-binding Zn-ribbon protein
MKRIREQLEILDNDVIALPALKEMHKLGLNEVSSLENTLSDYSLATEKMRCRSDPSEIQSSTRQILIENEALSKEIDELFLQRQKLLREIEQLEKDVNDKHTYLLRFFITSPKREVYLDVLTQMSNCGREKKNLEHLIMNLMEKKRLLLSDCQRSDDHKKEYTDACSEMEKLKTEVKGIDDELIVFQKSPEDALSLLEKRLRDVNARLCDLDEEAVIIDERYQTLLLRMQGLSQRRHELDKDHENTLNLASQYNNLVETEGVYSQQLQEVQAEIGQRSNELHDLKSHVLKLLNNISDIISRFDKAVPTEIEAKKIKAALTFKEKHLVMNVQTLDRLNYQREMRASEVSTQISWLFYELQLLQNYFHVVGPG